MEVAPVPVRIRYRNYDTCVLGQQYGLGIFFIGCGRLHQPDMSRKDLERCGSQGAPHPMGFAAVENEYVAAFMKKPTRSALRAAGGAKEKGFRRWRTNTLPYSRRMRRASYYLQCLRLKSSTLTFLREPALPACRFHNLIYRRLQRLPRCQISGLSGLRRAHALSLFATPPLVSI